MRWAWPAARNEAWAVMKGARGVDPFAIVCDSSHDLPPEVVEKLRLTVVPYTINFGAESSLDDGVMTLEEFAGLLDRYEKGKGYPTTAAPAPSRFVDAFLSHVRQGLRRILTVTISSKLSKTYDAAVQAACIVKKDYPDSAIEVVDSLNVSMAEGKLILEAARARDLGRPLQEAKRLVEEMRGRVRILAALETSKYLVKSGRAGRFQHMLGTVLRIKPIITAKHGATALYARVPGRMERAVDRIVDEVQRTYKSGVIWVVEGIAPDLREMLISRLGERVALNRDDILDARMTPTLMVHLGRRVVGVIWEE
jgi:DegV family protein with EDD domain